MADSHKPERISLVEGKIKRGDTIEEWSFTAVGIPSPEEALIVYSLHLENLGTEPLIRLDSDQSAWEGEEDPPYGRGAIDVTVEDGVLTAIIPRINAPAVGKLLWECQVRVPTILVAGPEGGVWTRTLFDGRIDAIQDGADRMLP